MAQSFRRSCLHSGEVISIRNHLAVIHPTNSRIKIPGDVDRNHKSVFFRAS